MAYKVPNAKVPSKPKKANQKHPLPKLPKTH